ncbi:Hypothetical predicted protein [Olea europaea subsp. europaea]|uniref:Uncharacterized protein n=1 Tax=Olea europaea subsp. europaea TaxID=158383 RepID=A0A8S0SK35_OLEEU|nr:Hypothetical predicted protein [Olea europaea subsp. europaea]
MFIAEIASKNSRALKTINQAIPKKLAELSGKRDNNHWRRDSVATMEMVV